MLDKGAILFLSMFFGAMAKASLMTGTPLLIKTFTPKNNPQLTGVASIQCRLYEDKKELTYNYFDSLSDIKNVPFQMPTDLINIKKMIANASKGPFVVINELPINYQTTYHSYHLRDDGRYLQSGLSIHLNSEGQFVNNTSNDAKKLIKLIDLFCDPIF